MLTLPFLEGFLRELVAFINKQLLLPGFIDVKLHVGLKGTRSKKGASGLYH